jgi:hypothetical protein
VEHEFWKLEFAGNASRFGFFLIDGNRRADDESAPTGSPAVLLSFCHSIMNRMSFELPDLFVLGLNIISGYY